MRILALRALGLGDLLTAIPALRGLRAHHPEARITLAVPAWLHPLIGWTGLADDALDVRSLSGGLPRTIGTVDLAVNLHGSGPQSHRLLRSASPGRLIAFRHPLEHDDPAAPTWQEEEHEIDRWCRLLRAEGVPADEQDLDVAVPPPLDGIGGRVVVHPGAKHGARRWPPERWAKVARTLDRWGLEPVITGSAGELALCRRVADRAGLPGRAVLAGRLDTLELASVVGSSPLVLSGDTGVAHLATALCRPSVVLFGPTPPSRWGPPRDRPWHQTIWHGRSGDPHGERPFPGVLAIEVDEVLEAAATSLEHDERIPAPSA